MGNDVFISGTMGAALQAHFRGIPAIAISVAALRDVHFDAAAQVARLLAQNVADARSPPPAAERQPAQPAPERIRGVSLTRLGRRTYMDVVNEGDDGRRKYYWIARDRPGWVLERGLDVWAVRQPPHLGHAGCESRDSDQVRTAHLHGRGHPRRKYLRRTGQAGVGSRVARCAYRPVHTVPAADGAPRAVVAPRSAPLLVR